MRAILYGVILSLVLASAAYANEIYITQIGDTLDLDITQDGTDNEFGDSTTDVTLDGDDMTFSITQTGNSNVIDAVIKGNTYTGTWTFTGNNNTVDLKCDDTSGTNCENVTLNIATVGDTKAESVVRRCDRIGGVRRQRQQFLCALCPLRPQFLP